MSVPAATMIAASKIEVLLFVLKYISTNHSEKKCDLYSKVIYFRLRIKKRLICNPALLSCEIQKLKRQKMLWLKTLLTEKEELEDLVEQYEANMSNATSLCVRIKEIVNNEKYNDDKYKEKILRRVSDATDEFKSFIDEEG